MCGPDQHSRSGSATVTAMTHLVLTAIGDDREGLVSALSRTVESHGGNWLDSQFSHLAGKFAGIVLIEIPASGVQELTAAAAALEGEVGLSVEVTQGRAQAPAAAEASASAAEARAVAVRLVGLDRPGLVRQISTALAEQRVSIGSFRSWTSSAPQGGGVLFEAESVVSVPAGLEIEVVRAALEPIADELMVDLELDEQP